MDIKDCPLELKSFDSVDSASAPNYFNTLKKPASEDIGLEDLDSLQLELENILSSCVIRRQYYKDESEVLAHLDKYKGKVKKVSTPESTFYIQLKKCNVTSFVMHLKDLEV